jgi:hypothetical protein
MASFSSGVLSFSGTGKGADLLVIFQNGSLVHLNGLHSFPERKGGERNNKSSVS